ncbi:MAG: hypothetical protein OXU26_12710 [Acidobacteriota bacterium]|nr:hypothetical protein [Acidobacteriota bacterium]MDE2964767.1 hypothetical protein [Acidobacteriota bacterium]
MKCLGLAGVLSIFVLSVWIGDLSAQGYCELRHSGLNQNRKIIGAVSTECDDGEGWWPGGHSLPFGNWGVTSNVGHKIDGHQFNGWCRNRYLCDSNGDCAWHCQDSWYEWNSCTTGSAWLSGNCDFYNYNHCTQQITTRGVNTHGSTATYVYVSCPYDSNDDGICDSGGCASVSSFYSGSNWMTLYELDEWDDDEVVQSLYFPSVTMSLNCDAMSCNSVTSSWLWPTSYDTPISPALVDARLAVRVNSGRFADRDGNCAMRAAVDERYDCY